MLWPVVKAVGKPVNNSINRFFFGALLGILDVDLSKGNLYLVQERRVAGPLLKTVAQGGAVI